MKGFALRPKAEAVALPALKNENRKAKPSGISFSKRVKGFEPSTFTLAR